MLRRTFVKYFTAGVAGQFILPAVGASAATSSSVVIVGGGMAGATAAKYLRLWARQKGLSSAVKVTIIDKSDSYTSNFRSNMVLTGELKMNALSYSYSKLRRRYGVNVIKATVNSVDTQAGAVYGQLNNTGPNVKLNDAPFSKLILATGISFDYSTFTLDVPANVYSNPYDAIPHAWQAGPQTTLLRQQLVDMTDGNAVVVTVPQSPYRNPPGPYQRACVLADWLKAKKPKSKLYLIDPNQTADGRPPVEPNNFGEAFSTIHKNIVYIQNAKLTGVTAEMSGSTKLKTLSLVPVTGALNNVNALNANREIVAEVANVIPKMQAAQLTRTVLAQSLDAGGWALIDELTYQSRQQLGIYVIGDSISSEYQPKSGSIATDQAKVCADGLIRDFTGKTPDATPVTSTTYFTPVTTALNAQYGAISSWLTATYRYGQDVTDGNYKMLPVSTDIESPGSPSKATYRSMNRWFRSVMQDSFS